MRIQIHDLPEASRTRLFAAVKNPPPGTFLINESRLGWTITGLGIALCCPLFVIAEADGYKWHQGDQFLFLSIVIFSFVAALISLRYVINWLRYDLKSVVLINPLYFLRIRFDQIEGFPLGSTKNWDVKHGKNAKGIYTGTTFHFYAETRQQTLKLNSRGAANDLVTALNGFPTYVATLVKNEDAATLYALDLLYEWRAREEQYPRASRIRPERFAFIVKHLGPALLAAKNKTAWPREEVRPSFF